MLAHHTAGPPNVQDPNTANFAPLRSARKPRARQPRRPARPGPQGRSAQDHRPALRNGRRDDQRART